VVALLAFVLIGGSLLAGSLSNGTRNMEGRLGADALIVPSGYEHEMEGALLRGEPSSFYLEPALVTSLLETEGIQKASPQIFISTFTSEHCSFPVQIIGYDPETDFVIGPWLEHTLPDGLPNGQVVVGSRVEGYPGDELLFYGRPYTVASRLERTGTGFDTSVFVNLETAEVALEDYVALGGHLNISGTEGAVSSIAVKVDPRYEIADFTRSIRSEYRDEPVGVVVTTAMISSVSGGLDILLGIITALIVLLWVLAVGVLALLFTVTFNERQREFGVYRALGATRGKLIRIALVEAGFLSFSGAVIGTALLSLVYFSFSPLIGISVDLPYLLPSASVIAVFLIGGLVASFITGPLAALSATLRISKQATAAILRVGD
jgi:putative ABC transport system permease protein